MPPLPDPLPPDPLRCRSLPRASEEEGDAAAAAAALGLGGCFWGGLAALRNALPKPVTILLTNAFFLRDRLASLAASLEVLPWEEDEEEEADLLPWPKRLAACLALCSAFFRFLSNSLLRATSLLACAYRLRKELNFSNKCSHFPLPSFASPK